MKEMDKLMKNLDSFNINEEDNVFSFLIKKGEELREEIKFFNKDYSKFRTGVFLWIKDKYPNFLEFLRIASKQKFSIEINVLNGMELVIKDYFNFIKDVKTFSKNLYEVEKLESEKLVFEKTTKPIKVPCVDFSKWILDTFKIDDYIILKINIEGAEYPVLNKMIKDGSIKYIDKLIIAFHSHKITSITKEEHDKLFKKLKVINMEVFGD